MQKKHIKKGQLLWWKRIGNSKNQNIDCPCVVTQIMKGQFTVTSFDDFMESNLISQDSPAFKEELKPTSRERATSFLKKKSAAIKKRVKQAKEELRDAQADQALFEYSESRIKWAIE